MRKIVYAAAVLTLFFTGCGSDKKSEGQELQNASVSEIKVTEDAVKTKNEQKKKESDGGQFYYSYNKENNSSTDETKNRRTTLDAYLNIRSPYEKVRITLMIKRLSKDYIIKCSPCHDDYANGVIGPSLLGKDADFIYKRIIAFKTGEKKNVLMRELVNKIENDKLKAIAKEIANFNKEILKMRRGK